MFIFHFFLYAVVYTVEFQKRGLPHAHIILWLDDSERFIDCDEIDKIISAEIPDPNHDPVLHEAVKAYMIHGPCGAARANSPCMKEGKCSKHFPKKFVDRTLRDEDGYCKYRRRDNGLTVERNGVHLDNRYVVPYNRKLLLRYQAHINVEFCNQSRAIKYLFKYVNKGNDKVTAAVCREEQDNNGENYVVDEIKIYYDCRYISACEGAWRIFGFVIHLREPAVIRLPFHLENEQPIVFEDNDPIDEVVEKSTGKFTKFTAWFEANKEHEAAKTLTYAQMPTKFVFNRELGKWTTRKAGDAIGRVYYVSPSAGELHYLRILINNKTGVTSYKELRTVDGTTYPTFKDACFVMGLLDDDMEYINAIKEVSEWSSAAYVRSMFASLIFHGCITRPDHVWEETWMHLSDDILLKRRHMTGDPGEYVYR